MSNRNRYDAAFARLKQEGCKAFIPFTILGYPDRARCLASVKEMIDAGATALELGIAFSDPLADGPQIQAASDQVIASGFGVDDAFDLLAEIRSIAGEIPIGLLVYYNTVLSRGSKKFYERACRAGVDGILIVDLPPESAGEVMVFARDCAIAQIFIVSPLTGAERLDLILKYAGGFLYGLTRLGLTGEKEQYDPLLGKMIAAVKDKTELPICLGFGVSTPQQAQNMVNLGADGVITGSKIIGLLHQAEEAGSFREYLDSMVNVLRPLPVHSL